MENLLKENGYVQGGAPHVWTKGDWTIRLYSDEIEVFNAIRKNVDAKYFKAPANEDIIQQIIEDIESF